MTPDLRIGTSGWSYPRGEGSWRGHFYPPGTADELKYYSGCFDTVEVNSSFYRPPSLETTSAWAGKTPDNFLFAVKLWQKFTHPVMYEAASGQPAAISAADVDTFRDCLAPLITRRKLGALLAQFPPSFVNDAAGRRMLEAVINAFGGCQLAVELRHRSWSDDPATARLLESQDTAWVRIDEPKFSFSVAAATPLTSSLAYFRFHGRNAADWWTGNNETRYRYLYSPPEIEELAAEVSSAARNSSRTLVYFNNHYQAYAPRNAGQLVMALGLPARESPQGGLLQ